MAAQGTILGSFRDGVAGRETDVSVLWRAPMSELTDAPPVLITCLRCGLEASRWVTIIWQHEQDRDGDVEVVSSDALAILCAPCGTQVCDAVRAAVDAATG
jgi:hypothetical protein